MPESTEKHNLQWKVNTPQLLNEIMKNNGTGVLLTPLRIFGSILYELGERCAELNDDHLNAIMCKLSIYAECDPYNKDFNQETVDELMKFYKTKSK